MTYPTYQRTGLSATSRYAGMISCVDPICTSVCTCIASLSMKGGNLKWPNMQQSALNQQRPPSQIPLLLASAPSHSLHSSSAPPMPVSFSQRPQQEALSLSVWPYSMVVSSSSSQAFRSSGRATPSAQQLFVPMVVSEWPWVLCFFPQPGFFPPPQGINPFLQGSLSSSWVGRSSPS